MRRQCNRPPEAAGFRALATIDASALTVAGAGGLAAGRVGGRVESSASHGAPSGPAATSRRMMASRIAAGSTG